MREIRLELSSVSREGGKKSAHKGSNTSFKLITGLMSSNHKGLCQSGLGWISNLRRNQWFLFMPVLEHETYLRSHYSSLNDYIVVSRDYVEVSAYNLLLFQCWRKKHKHGRLQN